MAYPVCVRYRNPNHWTNLNEIWHEYTPQWGKVCSWDSKPHTPTPGVRGALNIVWRASAASTVRFGENFYKTKVVLVGTGHIFGFIISAASSM